MASTIYEWLRLNHDRLTLAIVFTDIVGSTNLNARLGDSTYAGVRSAHFQKAREFIKQYNGHEVKNAGDSFTVIFRTAIEALNFAIALHDDTGDLRLRIRAGVHVGIVRIVEDRDIFGASANFAHRVMSAAKNGGVVISRDVKSQVDLEKDDQQIFLQYYAVNLPMAGFPGLHTLYLVHTPAMQAAATGRKLAEIALRLLGLGRGSQTAPAPVPVQPPAHQQSTPAKLEPQVIRRRLAPPAKTDKDALIRPTPIVNRIDPKKK
jgi:class 3 adenylate cyclase